MVARGVIYILTGQNCGHFRRFAGNSSELSMNFALQSIRKIQLPSRYTMNTLRAAPDERNTTRRTHVHTPPQHPRTASTPVQHPQPCAACMAGAIFDQLLLRRLYFHSAADVIAILVDKQSRRKPRWGAGEKSEVGLCPACRDREIFNERDDEGLLCEMLFAVNTS